MICIQCGAQNDETISYCRQCGTNLQAVRSALLGAPPPPPQQMMPSKQAPFVLVMTALFGFLAFGALFGAIIAIIAIGSEPNIRIAPDAFVFLAAFVAITGTIGIVMLIRTLLKAAATMIPTQVPAPVEWRAPDAGNRALPAPPRGSALPPHREPMSVVEHTTSHLPNYASPVRNTGE